jgi:folate-binding protein YgfZ
MYEHKTNEILLEGNAKMIAELKKTLALYKLRSKVVIEETKYKVYCDTVTSTSDPMRNKLQNNIVVSAADPRIDSFGSRIICSEDTSKNNEFLILIFSRSIKRLPFLAVEGTNDGNLLNWYHSREYLFGLIDGVEIFNKIPFECNLDLLNYYSFTKGCYVGQELSARTKYKGVIRKRLLPFHLAQPSSSSENNSSKSFQAISDSTVNDLLTKAMENSSNPLSSLKIGDKIYVTAAEAKANQKEIGEIVAVNSNKSIGMAMMHLDPVYQHQGNYSVSSPENGGSPGPDIVIFRPKWFEGLDEKTNMRKD